MFVLGLCPVLLWGVSDRKVQWGYKITYDSKIKPNQLFELRRALKKKNIEILFPSDAQWNIQAGYLNVSTYLEEQAIQEASSLIQDVLPAQKTRKLLLHLKNGLGLKEVKRLEKIFVRYKIQVMKYPHPTTPGLYAIKTALTAEQIRKLKDFQGYLSKIETET